MRKIMIYIILAIILNLMIGENIALNVNGTHDRIFNGIPALDGQYPYMAFIISGLYQPNPNLLSTCSGSLIGFDTILTAAHCFDRKPSSTVVVMVGLADARGYLFHRMNKPYDAKYSSRIMQESKASKIHVHHNYNKGFDIAIVKVSKPFVKTDFVNTIPYTLENYPGGVTCVVSGFGEDNNEDYGRLAYFFPKEVHSDVRRCGGDIPIKPIYYCINHRTMDTPSACAGDSGSPLVCEGKVYGVLVDVYHIDEKRECGSLGALTLIKLSQSEGDSLFMAIYSNRMYSKSYQLLPQSFVFITVLLLLWM